MLTSKVKYNDDKLTYVSLEGVARGMGTDGEYVLSRPHGPGEALNALIGAG